MNLKIHFHCSVVTFVLLLVPAVASAKSEGGAISRSPSFVRLSAGLGIDVGGNLWTKSENVPNYNLTPFDGYGGGWAAGGGLTLETDILWGFMGLEIDVLFERSTIWTEITHNLIVGGNEVEIGKTRWTLDGMNIRLPLLLKGILPLGAVRLFTIIGPEFVFSVSPNTNLEVTEETTNGALEGVAKLKNLFKARSQNDVFLSAGIGLSVVVWRTPISLSIRYGYNLTQPSGYNDRVKFKTNASGSTLESIEVIDSSSMDLRIVISGSYEIGF
ncbi:MAG: hypothetical protein GXP49_02095 [Deltaproteobacteria bacterium]|nr:hypothetical protein [Deltaproteobacteria bacterium]